MEYIKIGLYRYVITDDKDLKNLTIGTTFLVYLFIVIISAVIFRVNFDMLHSYVYNQYLYDSFAYNLELLLMFIICWRLIVYLRNTEAISDVVTKMVTFLVGNSSSFDIENIDILYTEDYMKQRNWAPNVSIVYHTLVFVVCIFIFTRIYLLVRGHILAIVPLEAASFVSMWLYDDTASKSIINYFIGN